MSTNYYRDVFEIVDDIFNNVFAIPRSSYQPMRFNKQISSGSFPPTNVVIDQKTKILTIQAALAGIHEDWINLGFDGDYLKLIVDVPNKEEDKTEESSNYYFQLGLKKVEHVESSWKVDPRYFDREKVNVEFVNGLLTITIPPREEVAPKKIPVFGGLKLEDKTAE